MDLANLTLRELTAGLHDVNDTPLSGNAGMSPASANPNTLRRCRTREQGIALLTISHAIEYLLDSRLSQREGPTSAEREALAILLSANLSVYREGAEVVPFSTRLRQWFHGGATKNESANATA